MGPCNTNGAQLYSNRYESNRKSSNTNWYQFYSGVNEPQVSQSFYQSRKRMGFYIIASGKNLSFLYM